VFMFQGPWNGPYGVFTRGAALEKDRPAATSTAGPDAATTTGDWRTWSLIAVSLKPRFAARTFGPQAKRCTRHRPAGRRPHSAAVAATGGISLQPLHPVEVRPSSGSGFQRARAG